MPSKLEHLEFLQTLDTASTAVRRAARKAAYNRLKRTEGVTVIPRKATPKPPSDPYSGFSPEQVEAANALKKRITGERDD